MGEHTWSVKLDDVPHTIHLSHGYWSGARQIRVDGQLCHEAPGNILVWVLGSRDVITVGIHTCTIRVKPNFRANRYDYTLEVGGQSQGNQGNAGRPAGQSARWQGGLLTGLAIVQIAQYGNERPWNYAWLASGLFLVLLRGAWAWLASGVLLIASSLYFALLYPVTGNRLALVVLCAFLFFVGIYHVWSFKRIRSRKAD